MSAAPLDPRIALAKANSEAARARLSQTLGTLQRRANPQVLAHDMADTIKVRGKEVLNGAVATAKQRPVPVGIGLTLIGLFLARGPIAKAIHHATHGTSKS